MAQKVYLPSLSPLLPLPLPLPLSLSLTLPLPHSPSSSLSLFLTLPLPHSPPLQLFHCLIRKVSIPFHIRYRVLSSIPDWLYNFYTDFSLSFPNYPLSHKNALNSNKSIKQSSKKRNTSTVHNKTHHKKEVTFDKFTAPKKTATEFFTHYLPKKSPFICGDLINSKMQLHKNGTLISYFARCGKIMKGSNASLTYLQLFTSSSSNNLSIAKKTQTPATQNSSPTKSLLTTLHFTFIVG
jgi:hypothetical protein